VRLEFLDQMRALAVLSVVIHHFHSSWFPGGIGVEMFFAISGFLISSALLEAEHPMRVSVTKFILRRIGNSVIRQPFPPRASGEK